MVDVLRNMQADRHTCGRPLTESLKDPDKPDPDYQVMEETCLACRAYDAYLAGRVEEDAKLREQGFHPERYRIHTMMPLAEVPEDAREAILKARRERRPQTT